LLAGFFEVTRARAQSAHLAGVGRTVTLVPGDLVINWIIAGVRILCELHRLLARTQRVLNGIQCLRSIEHAMQGE
jgi:hypothetical protein